jgi:uncharacterized repeat protein (TIGR04076 family)
MFPQPKKLTIEVVKVHGECPTHQVGDQFFIEDGHKLISSKPVCMHALQGLSPYYIPLSRGIPPYDLGLTAIDADQSSPEAFIHCLDPVQITGGGNVVFKIRVED